MSEHMNDAARKSDRRTFLFPDYSGDRSIRNIQKRWLANVWGSAPSGSYLFLATTDPKGTGWCDHPIKAEEMEASLPRLLRRYSRWKFNLYFAPNAFRRPQRKARFALSTDLAWCDMDASDPKRYRPQPCSVWETSPGRYQALWLWDRCHKPLEAETYSRALAYRHGGDSGWSVTKVLRVPGSVNHKPEYDEPYVKLIRQEWRPIAERPPIEKAGNGGRSDNYTNEFDPHRHRAETVIRKYESKVGHFINSLLRERRVIGADRSGRIYQMVASLHEAGAHPDEIAAVLWVNPYFISKYGRSKSQLDTELSRILSKLGGAS